MTSMKKVTVNFVVLTWIVLLLYLVKLYLLPFDGKTKLSLGYYSDSLLNFTELTKKYGYETEEHDVVTADGYILSVFHIVKSKNCKGTRKKPPVLLMHGFIESADIFLDAGPGLGLAYLISDTCFDLWIGNQRGNYYGRRHLYLDPDKDANFWNFSVEEMSYYDLPAMYDYILKTIGFDELNYIGYSQGGANFFIMCSERPEYCNKTKLMIALAPAAIITNIRSTAFKIMSQCVLMTRPILEYFGINELFNKGSIFQETLELVCQITETFVTDVLCGSGVLFDNYHPGSISYETQRTLYGHFPAGSSVHNFARYGQIVRSGRFQKYDYGEVVNLQKYGTKIPPEFNISKVTVPVVTVHGKNDILVAPEDMKRVEDLLPNLIDAVKIEDPLWTHLDIVYSQYSRDVIFSIIEKYLNRYNET